MSGFELEEARRRFALVHDSDPAGQATGYHRRVADWVTKLSENPSEALALAAACQHLARWKSPRDDFPEGRAGYKQWRTALARQHADDAETILREVGYGDAVVDRVRALLLKTGLKTDPEVQLFEDAICLTFIERQLDEFAEKHDDDKMVRILEKTWKKMSPIGHAAATELASKLGQRARALIARAVQA